MTNTPKHNPACKYECCAKWEERDGRGTCLAQTQSGYGCTRLEGHEGPHVACGIGDVHAMKVWHDSEPEPAPTPEKTFCLSSITLEAHAPVSMSDSEADDLMPQLEQISDRVEIYFEELVASRLGDKFKVKFS